VVRTTILDDTTAANRTAQHWSRQKEVKIKAVVWMWWTDGSSSDIGRVGAAAVYKCGNQWRSRCRFLGTRRMVVFDHNLWAMGLTLDVTIEMRETLPMHSVMMAAVFSDSPTTILLVKHPEPGPGQ